MKRPLTTAALVGAISIACINLAAAQKQYLGEIRLFGFNWCPNGWMQAAGQLLPISQYTALFSLYGTSFGGNGVQNFAIPNLSGRAPNGQASGGSGQPFGALYGSRTATLTVGQMPAHSHALIATSQGEGTNSPANALLPTFPMGQNIYSLSGSPANTPMAAPSIGSTGSNQPFSIQSPALSLNWCVAIVGIYPTRP